MSDGICTRWFTITLLLALASANTYGGSLRLSQCMGKEKRLEGRIHVSATSRKAQEQFSHIYATKYWGAEGKGSGPGSTLSATVLLMSIVRAVVLAFKNQALLDAPCGAMTWQPRLLEALQEDNSAFQYHGVDIVPQLIQDNMAHFRGKQNWRFSQLDITEQRLPEGLDLILSRDALQHLSCTDGVSALKNFALSNASFLLIGSYDVHANYNIPTGRFYNIDVRKQPFLLTNVLRTCNEHTSCFAREEGFKNVPDKLMLLYSIEYLRGQDFAVMQRNCELLPCKADACLHDGCAPFTTS